MKNIINRLLILSVATVFLFSSCTNWLTVYSDTDVLEKELFENGDGYRYALNGVYEIMADNSLYGKNLTYGFATVLSNLYTESSVTGNYSFRGSFSYLYSGLPEHENLIDGIYDPMWNKAYSAILNANNILSYIENESEELFEFGKLERDIIIGECKGIRALMHFEIFRFFGYAINESGASQERLPYVTDPKTTVPTYYNSKDYLELIIADLKEAIELTKEYDLMITEEFNWLRFESYIISDDDIASGDYLFMSSRGYRLNYFALNVLLSRAYMYSGDYDNAYATAEVIYNYGPEGEGVIEYSGFNDPKMSEEILFGSFNDELQEDYVMGTGGDEGYYLSIDNSLQYFGDDIDDLRYTELFLDGGGTFPIRWSYDSEFNDMIIPVVRYSEVVYIMMECMVRTECSKYNPTAALTMFDTFIQNGRNVHTSRLDNYQGATNELILEAIWNDIIRETMDEGYMPWLYKRNGAGFLYLEAPLPIPLDESDYLSYRD